MSKVCMNCGNQMDDSTMFCVNCGAPVPTPAPAAKPARASKPAGAGIGAFVKKNMKLVIAAAAALVVLVVVLILIFAKAPWEKALAKTMDVALEGKGKTLVDLAPDSYWEWSEEEWSISKDDIKSDGSKYAEEIAEQSQEIYGEKIKVKYEVVKEIKWTDEMVAQAGDALDERYEIDKNTVKAGYTVYMKGTVSGKNYATYSESMAMDFVKIGSKWYPCEFNYAYGEDADGKDREPSCYLVVESLLSESESYIDDRKPKED